MKKIKQSVIKHSPFVLSCLSSFGLVATVASSISVTPKAMETIKHDSRKKHDGDPYAYSKVEAIQSCWRYYIPSLLIGSATIACIFGANTLNRRNQASMTSAYALMDQSYKKYRTAANSVFGDDADKKIKAEIAKEKYISSGYGYLYQPHLDTSDEILFYDDYSMRFFKSTMAAVLNAQYHFNRNLSLRGCVTVNEFYGFLGIDNVENGDDFGWVIDALVESNIMWLDFENEFIELEDGIECYRLLTMFDPINLADYEVW